MVPGGWWLGISSSDIALPSPSSSPPTGQLTLKAGPISTDELKVRRQNDRFFECMTITSILSDMSEFGNCGPDMSPAAAVVTWNNGKSGAKLDFTSSTKPGLQIHKFDHTRTANLCDWLPCRCAALPLVGCLSATSPSC